MFEPGKVYSRRRDIHSVYGGQSQSGIVTPKGYPYIFLFTGDSGEQYGYKDDWTDDGVYLYTGEGQVGDMQFVRGNKSIRDHATNGKSLLLFKSLGKSKGNRFIGEFTCSSWETRTGQDRNKVPRDVIVFHLVPLDEGAEQEDEELPKANLNELRKRAYQAASPAAQSSIRTAKQTSYERSRDVKAYVLARAEGICESCREVAPFTRRDGSPYLEPHHTKRVSDGGPDDPRHVGAICPNCHREIHHGKNGTAKNSALEKYLMELERKHSSN